MKAASVRCRQPGSLHLQASITSDHDHGSSHQNRQKDRDSYNLQQGRDPVGSGRRWPAISPFYSCKGGRSVESPQFHCSLSLAHEVPDRATQFDTKATVRQFAEPTVKPEHKGLAISPSPVCCDEWRTHHGNACRHRSALTKQSGSRSSSDMSSINPACRVRARLMRVLSYPALMPLYEIP